MRAVLVLVILLSYRTASAQVDQEYSGPEVAWQNWWTIGVNRPQGQGFTPTVALNTGVALCLSIENQGQVPKPISLTVHEGTIDGTVVATASMLPTISGSRPCEWRYFPFDGGAVPLVPGQLYIIEADSETGFFGWYSSDGDYPRGPLVVSGQTDDSQDFYFRTYASFPLAAQFADVVALRRPDGAVEVTWSTLGEEDTLRFVLERGPGASGPFESISSTSAHGALAPYRLTDADPEIGRDRYRVVEYTSSGRGDASPLVSPGAAAVAKAASGAAGRTRGRAPAPTRR